MSFIFLFKTERLASLIFIEILLFLSFFWNESLALPFRPCPHVIMFFYDTSVFIEIRILAWIPSNALRGLHFQAATS